MAVQHCRPNRLNRRQWIGTAGSRGTFGNDHQAFAGVIRIRSRQFARWHGERSDISPPHRGRGVRNGGLDLLRIVATAVDDHQIRNSVGDVELTVEILLPCNQISPT